jgi:hypothetical protein
MPLQITTTPGLTATQDVEYRYDMAMSPTTAISVGKIRLGIFAAGDGLTLGQRILDLGEQTIGSGGTLIYSTNLPLGLGAGDYWLAAISDSAPALRAVQPGAALALVGSGALGSKPLTGWLVSLAYGAFPLDITNPVRDAVSSAVFLEFG